MVGMVGKQPCCPQALGDPPSGLLLPLRPAEANLLFGRGFRAGIDRREQKKTAAEAEADMLRRKREQTGTPIWGQQPSALASPPGSLLVVFGRLCQKGLP